MLSTPPAFVLSQDQTLYKMVSNRTVVRSNHFTELFVIASCFYSYRFRRIDCPVLQQLLGRPFRDFSRRSDPSGAFFSLRCLIYKVHAVPGGTLLLYKTSSRLSRTFFKSFRRPGPFCFAATCLGYHIFSLLSSGFFHRPRRGFHRPDSFVRIPDSAPIVNAFLQVF